MHNMTGFLSAAVGVAIAVVIWVVVVSLRKQRSGDAPQFDERQLAARARAYSSAFFTLLGYLAVVAVLDSVAEVRWCDLYTACFLGMMLALDVFAVAAIRSDAYFGIHERSDRVDRAVCVCGRAQSRCGDRPLRGRGAAAGKRSAYAHEQHEPHSGHRLCAGHGGVDRVGRARRREDA